MAEKLREKGRISQRVLVKAILVSINIALILFAIIFSLRYSNNLSETQKTTEIDTFCSTVDAMKQISVNYLQMEQGYAKDWSKYISGHDMTITEALDYINQAYK